MNIIVLDLETARSAKDVEGGWQNKASLGLSIGGYYDYFIDRIQWFDLHSLIDTISYLTTHKPLMVSFNGVAFDFPLMRAVVRHNFPPQVADEAEPMLQEFKALAAGSYDILAEIWRADSVGKYEKGLNSLDAIAQANNLPAKLGTGEEAPRWWAAGEHALVLNYCAHDIWLTRKLFERLQRTKGVLQRSTGSLQLLRYPDEAGEIINYARTD